MHVLQTATKEQSPVKAGHGTRQKVHDFGDRRAGRKEGLQGGAALISHQRQRSCRAAGTAAPHTSGKWAADAPGANWGAAPYPV